MVVKYGFAAQFIGSSEVTVELPDGLTDNEIKGLCERCLGVPWDDNCYCDIIKQNKTNF